MMVCCGAWMVQLGWLGVVWVSSSWTIQFRGVWASSRSSWRPGTRLDVAMASFKGFHACGFVGERGCVVVKEATASMASNKRVACGYDAAWLGWLLWNILAPVNCPWLLTWRLYAAPPAIMYHYHAHIIISQCQSDCWKYQYPVTQRKKGFVQSLKVCKTTSLPPVSRYGRGIQG